MRIDKVGNVLGERPGLAPRPHVVFSAHLDTVFPDSADVTVRRDGDRAPEATPAESTMLALDYLHMVAAGDIAKTTALLAQQVDPASGEAVRSEIFEAADGAWTRTLAQGDSVARSRVEAPASALPWVDLVHWPFELVLMRARGGQGGEAPLLSGGRPLAYTVTPAEGGGWTLTHPFRGPSVARVDAQGRLLSLDAAGTTRKVIVTRQPWVELEGPAARWAQADREGRGMGELSGRGREDATVAGARIVVDYGQPQRRGRDIFPGVVRWGELWRTGANRATHLTTDRALVLAGADGATLQVPAGEYTLFSIPQEDGGWLIVNRQTGQWGTEYDQAQDLARVPASADRAPGGPVEQFTMRIVASECGDGGVLQLVWENTRVSVPFTVAR